MLLLFDAVITVFSTDFITRMRSTVYTSTYLSKRIWPFQTGRSYAEGQLRDRHCVIGLPKWVFFETATVMSPSHGNESGYDKTQIHVDMAMYWRE